MSRKTLHYLSFSLISLASYGQEIFTTTDVEDLAAFNYEIYPSLNDVQIEEKTIAFNFSSLLNKPKINFGLSYTNNSIDFKDHDMYNDFGSFEEVHSIQVYAQYKKDLIKNWRLDLTIAPYISSTINEKISTDDFVFSYKANFVKSWDNSGFPSYLKIGAGYGTLFGKPNFYPLISYEKHVNEKFKYEIGIPVTGAYYKLNEKSSFDFTAQPESIYANNASGFIVNNNDVLHNSKLEFKAVKLALGYKFHLDENWTTNFNVGYLTNSELTIDNNDNKIYDFDANESLSLNVGISFNLNKKVK